LKNTKVKKWLRVDDAGAVLASTKRDEVEDNGDNDGNDDEEKKKKKELERKNKKKKSKKNSNIDTKGKDKEDVNKLARPEAGSDDDDDNSGKAAESVAAATAADLKKTRTTKEVEANAPAATTRGKEAEFGWSVVRPAEEGWACMLLLVELFAELNAAHGFDEERLAKLAGQLS